MRRMATIGVAVLALAAPATADPTPDASEGDTEGDAPAVPDDVPPADSAAAVDSLVGVAVAGALPGAPAIVIKTRASDRFCGGLAVTAKVSHGHAVVEADPVLAGVFRLQMPTNLDFTATDPARRKRSLATFNKWYRAFVKTGEAARVKYHHEAGDQEVALANRVVASARSVQALRWQAQALARGEIPASERGTAKAREDYCGFLAEEAGTFASDARDAAKACRRASASLAAGPGWWDDVCAK